MKNPKIRKAVAVALLGVGMALIAVPAYAAWEQCYTDGGYENPVALGTCTATIIATNPPQIEIKNNCKPATQVPKGWYCTSGDPYVTCNTLPDKQVNIEVFPEAKCEHTITPIVPTPENPDIGFIVTVNCVTSGVAVESEETAPVSNCETIYGAVG